jgi:alpha-galactosidase
MRGLRTIPVMIEMGNEMAELCPDGLLLNYTNPMAMVPWGVYAGSPFQNVVGVCHSVRDTHEFLAGLVGVPEEDVAFRTAGFNHQCFVYTFRDRRTGEDLYPRLRAAVENDPDLQRRVRVELFRRFGYFPTESSEHSAEYLPWFMRSDSDLERFRIPVDEYVRRSEENLEIYADLKARLRDGRGFEIERSVEYAPEIVHAMVTGQPAVIYGNVVNDGLIDNLPAGACVEVPCVIDRTGVQPTHVGPLPVQCAALNRTFLNVVELTVAAALEGSREHVYHAAMLDPNASGSLGLDEIRAVCDELIEAHGDALPALA